MGANSSQRAWRRTIFNFACCALLALAGGVRADQVEMQNGDRYVGKVLSLNATTLVVQNEVLGVVRIPRDKVASISLGAGAVATIPPGASAVPPAAASVAPPVTGRALVITNAAPDPNSPFRELAAHTNMIHKIQSQFLGDAGPEANKKFEEMLSGLMNGQISMDDLQAQAQSAAEQLRALKNSGQDNGIATDSYLAILDQFLKSQPATPGGRTNAPAQKGQAPAAEEN